MKLVTVETKDLAGRALDWAVAEHVSGMLMTGTTPFDRLGDYAPSTKWAQGGPVLEMCKVEIAYFGGKARACIQEVTKHSEVYTTSAYTAFYAELDGTLLVAMRAAVQKVAGSRVSVPAELLGVFV